MNTSTTTQLNHIQVERNLSPLPEDLKTQIKDLLNSNPPQYKH